MGDRRLAPSGNTPLAVKILPAIFLALVLACPCVAAATEEEINQWKPGMRKRRGN